MADAPKLLGTDTLRQAYPKFNQAIDNANEALSTANTAKTNSDNAVNTANSAEQKADSVQEQFNQVVIEGDSSVEAAQARLDGYGNTFGTLKERLDFSDERIMDRGVNLESFPKLTVEANDHQRFQRALDSMPNGGILIIPKSIEIDDVLINTSGLTVLVINSTLTASTIEFTGDNSGVEGINGVISGKLKVGTLAQETPINSNVLVFESHDFTTSDRLYSSYGLRDSLGSVSITNVNGNQLTVAMNTFDKLPAGAIVGNYEWITTFKMRGQNNFLRNLTIINSQGYAADFVAGTGIVEHVRIENNGLDLTRVADGAEVIFKDVHFGYIYDPAKQAISIINNPKVYCEGCTFERDNYDVEFYLYGDHEKTEVVAKNCKFIGTRTNAHPAPYHKNSWAVVNLDVNDGSVINHIKLINCESVDYNQGVITQPYENVNGLAVNMIRVIDCDIKRSLLGDMSKVTCPDYKIIRSSIDNENIYNNVDYNLVSTSQKTPIGYENCLFKNDSSRVVFTYSTLKDCTFENMLKVFFDYTSKGFSCTFDNAPVSAYPNWEEDAKIALFDSRFAHPELVFQTEQAVNVLPANQGVIDFKLKNGSLNGYIYNDSYSIKYLLEIKRFANVGGFIGDDWNIPLNSRIEFMAGLTNTDRFKYVIKSVRTILSQTAASGATSVVLAGTYSMAAGDYINISLDNGLVHTAKVTAINGNTLTLDKAFPSQASTSKNACVYLF